MKTIVVKFHAGKTVYHGVYYYYWFEKERGEGGN